MATKVIKNKLTHSFERRNTPTDLKKTSTTGSTGSRKNNSFPDKPTPLDFDNFVPWVCSEWQIPEMVKVIRVNQEKNIRTERRTSSGKTKSIRSSKTKEDEELTSKRGFPSTTNSKHSELESTICITAYYDSRGHLTEIAILACPIALHRKIMQAISLCVPFHSFLTKLVLRKGCLNFVLIHEISKLLPHSNLTDICLDGTYVSEGNYYVLLDQASNLKYLSLNRCRINDDVCQEIALRIDLGRPAEKSLLLLDLSSNIITDVGAQYFGEILRRNRHLLHLNFLGNRITDIGLEYLVKHLQEFPLTEDEIIGKKRRKMDYCRNRNEVYERCLEEIDRLQKSEELGSLQSDRRSSLNNKNAKFKKTKKPLPQLVEEPSRTDLAKKMTLQIVNELKDPFDDISIFKRDGYLYSRGNLRFCSLNVAYNHIEFPSLLKIIKVLSYQDLLAKKSPNTGLMRICLDGNYLPHFCPELDQIDMYLKKACNSQIPVSGHSTKRRMSILGKHKV